MLWEPKQQSKSLTPILYQPFKTPHNKSKNYTLVFAIEAIVTLIDHSRINSRHRCFDKQQPHYHSSNSGRNRSRFDHFLKKSHTSLHYHVPKTSRSPNGYYPRSHERFSRYMNSCFRQNNTPYRSTSKPPIDRYRSQLHSNLISHSNYTFRCTNNSTQQPTLTSHDQSLTEPKLEIDMYHPTFSPYCTRFIITSSAPANTQANAITPFTWFVNL